MSKGQTLLISGFFILISLISSAQDKVVLSDVDIVEDRVKRSKHYEGVIDRPIDILHMELEVGLNWEKHALFGQADLYIKPFYNPVDSVVLDAKGFKINTIAQVIGGQLEKRKYAYDGFQLRIGLDRAYSKDEVIHLYIDYISLPDSLNSKGGRAIRDAKGFYFIDETPEYKRQFWTQGEPESNSAWFPTIDKPNERFTHQIGITVDSTWLTCSNGALEFKTQNGDGTRTDYWVMDKTNPPYLVMIGGGEMDTVGLTWNGKPVRYFVDEKWKSSAAEIFKYTPEMLTFFGEKLGVAFPWQKYDQFVAREYVSGAMENTTATVHGDFVYRDQRALQDKTAEDLIAHEMFHQWFGDLVTCENWANLPLNESFASFGELMWHEHKYDADDVAWFLRNERLSYLREFNSGKAVKMIRYEYDDPDDMFDRHSYQRGTCVLYMLKHTVGEDAFYASLQKYLTDNAFQPAEISDLQRAFKQVTGQDLRWFFDQWFHEPGHPKLHVSNIWDKENGKLTLTVKQQQDVSRFPVYRLPASIDVYTQLGYKRYQVVLDKQEQDFVFNVESQPYLVKFDADNYLLAEIEVEQTNAFWLHQLGNSKSLMDRHNAIKHLLNTSNTNLKSTIVGIALSDAHFSNKLIGLNSASTWDENAKKKLKGRVKRLMEDENNQVKAAAIAVWSSIYKEDDVKLYKEALDFDSYTVNKAGLWALALYQPKEAIAIAKSGVKEKNKWWSGTCASVLAEFGSPADLQEMADWAKKQPRNTRMEIYFSLLYSIDRGGESGKKCVDIITEVAKTDQDGQLRYYAQQLMEEMAYEMEEKSKTEEKERAKELKDMVKYTRDKIKTISTKQ